MFISTQGFCSQQRTSHLPVVTATHVCKHCQIGGQKPPPVGNQCFQRYSMHQQPEVCVPLLVFLPSLVAHRVPVQLTGRFVQGAGPGLRRRRRSLTRSRMSWSTSCSPPPAPSRAGGERERLAASCLSVRVTRAVGGRPAPSRRPWASARYPEACSPRPGPTSGLRGRRSAASGRRLFLTAWACASSSCQHRRNSSRLWLLIAAAPGAPTSSSAPPVPRDSPSAGSVPLGRKLEPPRHLGSGGRPRPRRAPHAVPGARGSVPRTRAQPVCFPAYGFRETQTLRQALFLYPTNMRGATLVGQALGIEPLNLPPSPNPLRGGKERTLNK